MNKFRSVWVTAAAAALVAACSGGAGGGPAPTYAISGNVTGGATSGVTVTLMGAANSTTTDASGNYKFTGLANGMYTVTPSLAGVTFTPPSIAVTVSGASVANQNFVETLPTALALGAPLIPGTTVSSNQLRLSLLPTSTGVLFTDASATPLKGASASTVAASPTGVPLANRLEGPQSVTIAGAYALWVDGVRLNLTPLAGGLTSVLQTGVRDTLLGTTADTAADSTNAYWVNTSSASCSVGPCQWLIQEVPLAGGAAMTLTSVSRPVVALAADANNIYWEEGWIEPVSPGCNCGSQLKMMSKSTHAITVLVDGQLAGTIASGNASWQPTGGLASNGSQVVFGVAGLAAYKVMSVANVPTAGAVTALATVSSPAGFALNSIQGLATDGTNAYWVDASNAAVYRAPLASGAATAIAPTLTTPKGLALSGGNILWTEIGPFVGCCLQMAAGSIRSVPATGGSATTLFSGLDFPVAVAADGAGNIAWTEPWRIALSSAGAAPVTIAGGVASDVARIAADTSNIYVLDGDYIKKLPIAGGIPMKLAAAHAPNLGDASAIDYDITTDGTNVYWTVGSISNSAPTVRSVPVAGGSVTTLALEGAGSRPMDCYWRIAVDAVNVYWTSISQYPIGCSIRKVPIAGGSVTPLVDYAYLRDFVVDGTNVYFSEAGSNPGSIRQIPVSGNASTTFATNVLGWVMAQDAANLYWMDPSPHTGGIFRLPKAGGSQTTLVPGPVATNVLVEADAIAVTPTALYWSESLVGAIFSRTLP